MNFVKKFIFLLLLSLNSSSFVFSMEDPKDPKTPPHTPPQSPRQIQPQTPPRVAPATLILNIASRYFDPTATPARQKPVSGIDPRLLGIPGSGKTTLLETSFLGSISEEDDLGTVPLIGPLTVIGKKGARPVQVLPPAPAPLPAPTPSTMPLETTSQPTSSSSSSSSSPSMPIPNPIGSQGNKRHDVRQGKDIVTGSCSYVPKTPEHALGRRRGTHHTPFNGVVFKTMSPLVKTTPKSKLCCFAKNLALLKGVKRDRAKLSQNLEDLRNGRVPTNDTGEFNSCFLEYLPKDCLLFAPKGITDEKEKFKEYQKIIQNIKLENELLDPQKLASGTKSFAFLLDVIDDLLKKSEISKEVVWEKVKDSFKKSIIQTNLKYIEEFYSYIQKLMDDKDIKTTTGLVDSIAEKRVFISNELLRMVCLKTDIPEMPYVYVVKSEFEKKLLHLIIDFVNDRILRSKLLLLNLEHVLFPEYSEGVVKGGHCLNPGSMVARENMSADFRAFRLLRDKLVCTKQAEGQRPCLGLWELDGSLLPEEEGSGSGASTSTAAPKPKPIVIKRFVGKKLKLSTFYPDNTGEEDIIHAALFIYSRNLKHKCFVSNQTLDGTSNSPVIAQNIIEYCEPINCSVQITFHPKHNFFSDKPALKIDTINTVFPLICFNFDCNKDLKNLIKDFIKTFGLDFIKNWINLFEFSGGVFTKKNINQNIVISRFRCDKEIVKVLLFNGINFYINSSLENTEIKDKLIFFLKIIKEITDCKNEKLLNFKILNLYKTNIEYIIYKLDILSKHLFQFNGGIGMKYFLFELIRIKDNIKILKNKINHDLFSFKKMNILSGLIQQFDESLNNVIVKINFSKEYFNEINFLVELSEKINNLINF